MNPTLLKLIWLARLAAFDVFWEEDVPSAAVVLAIIEHESRGNPRVCLNEKNGSSSRGLMMWNRPHSRCTPEDNERYAADFDPARNIRRGVFLLAWQAQWSRQHPCPPNPTKKERKHCAEGDPLALYAGRGPEAQEFARTIRAMVKAMLEERP